MSSTSARHVHVLPIIPGWTVDEMIRWVRQGLALPMVSHDDNDWQAHVCHDPECHSSWWARG